MTEADNLVPQLLRDMRENMATKGDLSELRAEMHDTGEDLRSEVHALRADVASDLMTTRKDLSDQIVGLRRAVVANDARLRSMEAREGSRIEDQNKRSSCEQVVTPEVARDEVPEYVVLVDKHGLSILMAPGDFSLENGGLRMTKDGGPQIGDDVYSAMFRLVQAWRFSRPHLAQVFALSVEMAERRARHAEKTEKIAEETHNAYDWAEPGPIILRRCARLSRRPTRSN